MRFFTVIFFLLILQKQATFGQAVPAAQDKSMANAEAVVSPKYPAETAYPISLYKEATSINQNLYNGRLYYVYDARSEEHQFYGDRKWQKGVVYYDGQRFDSIPMIYDIVKDELVIKHFNGDHVLLQTEKVDYFLKDHHVFKRLDAGKDINAQMHTGFYDIIYEGQSKFIIRRNKQRQEKIAEKKVISLFPEKDFYYVRHGERYHSVRSKKSVFGLFPERKKELRKALRDKKIKFRKNRELAIATIVVTYDASAKP